MNTATNPLAFETETCSRCGGCGRYSYCQSYGSTCFKCHGKGKTLTKRGFAANQWLRARREIPASEIKIGMLIRIDEVTPSGISYTNTVRVDKASTENSPAKYLDKATGQYVPYLELAGANVKNGQRSGICCFPDSKIYVVGTKEERLAQLAEAIEYQNSLTQQGKPRKRKEVK